MAACIYFPVTGNNVVRCPGWPHCWLLPSLQHACCAFHLAMLAGRTLVAAGPYCRNPLSCSRSFRMWVNCKESTPRTLSYTILSLHLASRTLHFTWPLKSSLWTICNELTVWQIDMWQLEQLVVTVVKFFFVFLAKSDDGNFLCD